MKRRGAKACKEAKTALCFLAPSLGGIAAMSLLPTIDVVRRSFFCAMGDRFTGLDNFVAVLTNGPFLLALKNTGRFVLVCIPLLLTLSLLASALLLRQRWCASLLKTTYLLPMAAPVASAALIIQTIFAKNGLLSALCALFGKAPTDWLNSEYAFMVLTLCYLWKNLGYHVVLWMAGLSAIPASLYEAARIDGANEWQCFMYVTLPQLRPTLFMAAVLALVNSFKVFREAYLVAGRYPHTSIYMLGHVLSNWFANLDMQKISAAAVLLLGMILLVVFCLARLSAEKGETL